MGERLRKGQHKFEDMPPTLRTAHDVRKLRSCAYCGRLGSSETMLDTSAKQWWHGRCFVKKFGVELLMVQDVDAISRLTLGDLGVDLMKRIMDGISEKQP